MLTIKNMLLLKPVFPSDKDVPLACGIFARGDDEDMCHEPSHLQSSGLPKLTAVKLFVTLKDKHICPFSLHYHECCSVSLQL